MFVVASGNPFDGLVLHGPFDSVEDANGWAETELRRETWWVMKLEEP